MYLISKENIDYIKQNILAVDVARDFGIEIKRKVARCIFHSDQNPSMSFKDGMFKCFSCGAAGDVFELVKKIRNCDFREAVEIISAKYSILVKYDCKNVDMEKVKSQEYFDCFTQELCNMFHKSLFTAQGKPYFDYIKNRGIDLEAITEFKIGVSLSFDKVESVARQHKSIDVMKALKCPKIAFNKRIVFPIFNKRNRCAGFSCRRIEEDASAKYINTGRSEFFNKTTCFFGEHIAKRYIEEEECAVLVEGQIDAIALFAMGIKNVLSVQGTSFSEEGVYHIKNMGAKKVFIFFDGDNAGVKATLKIVELFLKKNVMAFVYPTSEGCDPAIIAKRKDGKFNMSSFRIDCVRGDVLLDKKIFFDIASNESIKDIEMNSINDVLETRDVYFKDKANQMIQMKNMEIRKHALQEKKENKNVKAVGGTTKQVDENLIFLIKLLTSASYDDIKFDLSKSKDIFVAQEGRLWNYAVDTFSQEKHLRFCDLRNFIINDDILDDSIADLIDRIDIMGISKNFDGAPLSKLFSMIAKSMDMNLKERS